VDEVCACDVLSHPVVSIDEQTHIEEAVTLLRKRRLPVTNANGQLCGLVNPDRSTQRLRGRA
jgi:CBS domain-containing protein